MKENVLTVFLTLCKPYPRSCRASTNCAFCSGENLANMVPLTHIYDKKALKLMYICCYITECLILESCILFQLIKNLHKSYLNSQCLAKKNTCNNFFIYSCGIDLELC